MAATVRINGRTVVHAKSEGISIAFPDVCKTPGAGAVPYTNVATSTEAANTSATVYADGESVMLKDSYFARSVGDEAGTGGGVISGTFNGRASFTNYSFDVMIEGRNVCRLGDPMIHNHGSPPNACSPYELQPDIVDPQMAAICLAVCMCDFPGGKMACCQQMLAESRWDANRHYYDPYVPGLYIEVSIDMNRSIWDGKSYGTPEVNLSPEVRSKHQRDKQGNPLPLPGGDFPYIPGSRRPDLVIAKDPTKPLTRDNIKRVLDIKYPPDKWGRGQKDDYRRIDPAHDDPIEVTPQYCGCTPDQVIPEVEQEQVEKDIAREDQLLRQARQESEDRKEKEQEERDMDKGKEWGLKPVTVVLILIALIHSYWDRNAPVPVPTP